MLRPAAFVLALTTSACSLSADVLEIPTEGARSVIVVVETEDAAPELRAFALSEGSRTIAWPLEGVRDGALHVLRYDCALDALALAPGSLDLSTGTGRPLPDTEEVDTTRVEGGTAGAWSAARIEGSLAALRLVDEASLDPCLDFDVVSFTVPGSAEDQIEAVVALSDDEVLLMTSSGRLFRASIAGGLEALPGLPSTTPSDGGVVDEAGGLWLFSGSGATAYGTLDTGFAPGPSMPVSPGCLRIARSPRGAPFEVFVAGCEPVVLHFDGATWTLLDQSELPARREGGIAWIGPGQAVAIGPDFPALSSYAQRDKRVELAPIPSPDAPRSVARTSTFGVLAGTGGGNTVRREGGGWTPFAAGNHIRSIDLMFDIPDGILIGGDEGLFTQYREGLGQCSTELAVAGDAELGAQLGERIVVVGHVIDDAVAFLTPRVRRAPSRCP
jgi:hypothetical protein